MKYLLIKGRTQGDDHKSRSRITIKKHPSFDAALEDLLSTAFCDYDEIVSDKYTHEQFERIYSYLLSGKAIYRSFDRVTWAYYTIVPNSDEIEIPHSLNKRDSITLDELLESENGE